jgi:hypothetical protein
MNTISMIDTLTEHGTMVKEGHVIGFDVTVKHHMIDNSLSIDYVDTNNCRQTTARDITTGYSLIKDSNNNIMGVLPKQEDSWYLFWNN